ncbi:MAG: FlgD immunoglobulin-like domain containing protein, partial [Alkalispirochaetaceae bacterium]
LPATITADDIFTDRIVTTGDDRVYDRAENFLPSIDVRRISDVGIGVIEPVYAADEFRTGEAGFETLREFDGSGFLADTDITLQARILAPSFTGLPTSLVYDLGVDESVTIGDYWSSIFLPGLTEGEDGEPIINEAARTRSPFDRNGALRTFLIPGSDPEIEGGGDLEFQFVLGGIPAARATDPEDPLSLAPWGFGIGGVIEQRGGVTILNNVINPQAGERTVLTYEINRAGMALIQVFTLDGSLVRVLQRGRLGEGSYSTAWDGRNLSGQIVTPGIYFIRVVAPGIDEYRKVMIVD